jgi:hypothetical protein
VFANKKMDAWYSSPYPDEYGENELLFVCHRCFKYMQHAETYLDHLDVCEFEPPGHVIYAHETVHIYQVDGKEHKVITYR